MGLHLLSFVGFVISGVFARLARVGDRAVGQVVAQRPSRAGRAPAAARAPARAAGPGRPALSALRVDRRPERVQHRLLGRLDDGGEERVEVRVGDGGRVDADRRCLVALDSPRSRRRRRSRRSRDGRPSPCARARGPRAARDARAAPAAERRVGRDDGDAAACRRARVDAVADRREDRHAVDSQILRRAEVREHEHADGRVDLGDEAAGRADAALPAERDHARAGADAALADGSGHRRRGRRGRRRPPRPAPMRASLSQLSSHSPTTGITTLVGADRRIRLTRDARRRRRRSGRRPSSR